MKFTTGLFEPKGLVYISTSNKDNSSKWTQEGRICIHKFKPAYEKSHVGRRLSIDINIKSSLFIIHLARTWVALYNWNTMQLLLIFHDAWYMHQKMCQIKTHLLKMFFGLIQQLFLADNVLSHTFRSSNYLTFFRQKQTCLHSTDLPLSALTSTPQTNCSISSCGTMYILL